MMNNIRLRNLRRGKGLSQMELAQLLKMSGIKISQPRISFLERGLEPYQKEAEAMANILGVSPDELFPRELTK